MRNICNETVMPDPLALQTLDQYRIPVIGFDCPRCRRNAQVEVAKLRAKFGGKLTLGEVARQVAASRGCALAQDADHSLCSVRPVEPPVHHWATARSREAGRLVGGAVVWPAARGAEDG
jgi:hypothetical protein